MSATYKNSRIQGTASTSTYSTLYSVPSGKSAVISTISIANLSATDATYRIAILDTETTPTSTDWLVYDSVVAGNDSTFISVGITLTATQRIRISSSANTTTFMCFISEIS
jgi:hypothetical protein